MRMCIIGCLEEEGWLRVSLSPYIQLCGLEREAERGITRFVHGADLVFHRLSCVVIFLSSTTTSLSQIKDCFPQRPLNL